MVHDTLIKHDVERNVPYVVFPLPHFPFPSPFLSFLVRPEAIACGADLSFTCDVFH